MIEQIPIQPVPNQQLITTLNGQQCVINLYLRSYNDLGVPVGTEPLYVTTTDGFLDTLCINPSDPTDVLLVTTQLNPDYTPDWNNIYMDLFVGGQNVFSGQPVVFGSYINQYISPLFTGWLYIDTEDGLDPVYTDFGNTTTLNYTDGVLNNNSTA